MSLTLAVTAYFRGSAIRPHAFSLSAAALWTWMWILIAGNTRNADLEGYLYFYESTNVPSGVGPGYWFLVEAARAAGLDYFQFLAICAAFSLLVMALVASWFTNRTALVATFYFLYPFVFDAIQARNMLAMSLIILAFGLRAKHPRAGWVVLASIVAVASTIHLTMLVFGLALIVRLAGASRAATVAFWTGIAAVPVVSIFPSSLGPVSGLLLDQLDAARFGSYFSTRAEFGILLFTSIHLSSIMLLRLVTARVHTCATSDDVPADPTSAPQTRFVFAIYRTSLFATVLLPLVAVNSNFFRLFRDLWFLYAICFAIGIEAERKVGGSRSILAYGTLLLAAQSLAFVVLDYDAVLQPILGYNRIVDSVSE